MDLDMTIRLGDILMAALSLVIAPALWTFGKALSQMRDNIATLAQHMGTVEPPIGVLGDITHLKQEVRRHRDWLIEHGIIHPGDRT